MTDQSASTRTTHGHPTKLDITNRISVSQKRTRSMKFQSSVANVDVYIENYGQTDCCFSFPASETHKHIDGEAIVLQVYAAWVSA
jgi:hypothetical protein